MDRVANSTAEMNMKFLGLYPDSIVARVRASPKPTRVPTLAGSLAVGAGGFCLVGAVVSIGKTAAHEPLQNQVGEIAANACWAALFILMGGGLLSRLVIGPGRLLRFYILFALAFLLYGTAWTAAVLPLRNKLGEWLGSLLGTAMMGLTFATGFDALRQAVKVIVVLFLTRSAGYLCAESLHGLVPGMAGSLLWGLPFGLGLGTGLGYALHACQEPARAALKTLADARDSSRQIRR